MTRDGRAPGLTDAQLRAFIDVERLPAEFGRSIDEHFLPLAEWIAAQHQAHRTLVVGISGAQGTGKSTLAGLLERALGAAGLRVASLSLDDFYLPRSERQELAANVHPLLATRGVPGTHDVALLLSVIDRLASADTSLQVPRFDKALDDRVPVGEWRILRGPADVVLLEGWCIGSVAEAAPALAKPVNALEADEDPDGTWRRWVNDRLAGDYARLNSKLDRLVYLAAPDFEAVYRWRLEQEDKLRTTTAGRSARLMGPEELRRFLMHYERITRANATVLPVIADAVLEFDERHRCARSRLGRRATGA
ncbi:MAG: kinase [Gammaproteobacteria bacterium]|nr:kinase [Gammaproteobacteria bacterium]MDH4254640.1 kinase [Gammaproteobacteria bacterium]MDH5309468.1 kinase [Gammaproteobacteria bacterium]